MQSQNNERVIKYPYLCFHFCVDVFEMIGDSEALDRAEGEVVSVVAIFRKNDASVLYRIDREYTGVRL